MRTAVIASDLNACRACQTHFNQTEPSGSYPGYCMHCAEEVLAFRPNPEVDEWYFVTSDEDLVEPLEFSPAQCGHCGGSFFRAENGGALGVIVGCIDGEYADGPHSGCAWTFSTVLMPSYQVIF